MKTESVTLLEWQERFGTEEGCLSQLIHYRWPDGFICPHCGHDQGYFIGGRHIYQCTACARQVSVTAGTIFEASKLPLVKWFWAIYLMASDKGGISALRLAQQIEVSWITAHRMLRKIRQAMGHRDSLYRLGDMVEVDDALVGGRLRAESGAEARKARRRFWWRWKTGARKPDMWRWKRLHR